MPYSSTHLTESIVVYYSSELLMHNLTKVSKTFPLRIAYRHFRCKFNMTIYSNCSSITYRITVSLSTSRVRPGLKCTPKYFSASLQEMVSWPIFKSSILSHHILYQQQTEVIFALKTIPISVPLTQQISSIFCKEPTEAESRIISSAYTKHLIYVPWIWHPRSAKTNDFIGQPFEKRFALCYRTVVRPVLSCPIMSVCNVRALRPNGWTNQDETWHAGRPRLWPHCIRRGPSSHPLKGAQPPNFRPISVASKWLHGSRCHWAWR